MKLSRLLEVVCFLTGGVGVLAISIEVNSTRSEGLFKPLSLSTTTPRLSWRLTSTNRNDSQTAYQIQVATSQSALGDLAPDLWDTGKVASAEISALYAGTSLKSRSIGWWRVRAWDVEDNQGSWSPSTSFELGLLSPLDWMAKWIGNTQYKMGVNSLPLLAKNFTVSCGNIPKARLYLLGLGQHAALVNGLAVGDDVLAPGYSNPNKTILYSTYDITGSIHHGANVVGVELGKSFWDPEAALYGRYMKYDISPVQLMMIAQLEYTCSDGTSHVIASDETWLSSVEGPRLESSWYGGEEFDARKNIPLWSTPAGDHATWSTANLTSPPPGALVTPRFPPLKVVDSFPAVNVSGPVDGQYVFDFGVNFAGWYALQINEPANTKVTIWPAERLKSTGAIDQSTTGSPIWDAYTSNGTAGTYSPKFMYHGMRYLGVNLTSEPSASALTALVIRTSADSVGSVQTSDSMLNSIHKIIDRAIQSNLYSVMTDCPHREKFGWLEQTQLVFDPVTRGYDIQAMGKGVVQTIADSLVATGLIPDIAPEYTIFSGGFRDDPNWGSAMILLPLMLYNTYGDIDLLTSNYATMKTYLNYLTEKSSNYLLNYGLGDWITFDNTTPVGITATYGYAKAVAGMVTIANATDQSSDASMYSSLLGNILKSFHDTYFHSGNVTYGSNSQACNALALDMGAVPAEYQTAILKNIVSSIVNNSNHLTVGEIALPSLVRSLNAFGADDTIYDMVVNPTSPSYAYQVLHGATSLTERWDGPTASCSGCNSLNHFMLGYIDRWLAQLSGVSQSSSSHSWNSINFSPIMLKTLVSAVSTYRSPKGLVAASWELDDGTMYYNVTVPVGAVGTVTLPFGTVTENGDPPEVGKMGVHSLMQSNGTTIVVVGSGDYTFVAS